jgi:hypothetical protein
MFSSTRHAGKNQYRLGQRYFDQQKYVEAEQLLRQSVQQREKVLGADYKDTLASKELLQKVFLPKVPPAPTNGPAMRQARLLNRVRYLTIA